MTDVIFIRSAMENFVLSGLIAAVERRGRYEEGYDAG